MRGLSPWVRQVRQVRQGPVPGAPGQVWVSVGLQQVWGWVRAAVAVQQPKPPELPVWTWRHVRLQYRLPVWMEEPGASGASV